MLRRKDEGVAQTTNDNGATQPQPALNSTSQSSQNYKERSYGNTSVSGRAKVILGNVFHQHNYYNKERSLVRTAEAHTSIALNQSVSSIYAEAQNESLPDLVSSYDAFEAHLSHYQELAPDTCHWIESVTDYRDWLAGAGPPILICTGSVGCGKSTVASVCIANLQAYAKDSGLICVHYFVDNLRSTPTLASDILRACIKQLLVAHCHDSNELPDDLDRQIRSALVDSRKNCSMETISGILAGFKQLFPYCLFVVDGIDALPETEILIFLKFLRQHFTATDNTNNNHKILIFCRDILGRGIHLDNVPCSSAIQIRLGDIQQDLYRYVDYKIEEKQLERVISDNLDIVERIRTALKQNSEKMFLWIKLQIQMLWDLNVTTCEEDIEEQLNSLPQGLDEIYIRCLRRMETSNYGKSREVAPRIFRWVAMAKQPLTSRQAREASSMTSTNLPLSAKNLLSSPVTEFCANLIEVDHKSDTVKFTHRSAKDLLQDPTKLPSDLTKYALCPETDDLWCGEICMAYAQIHHERKSVVVYQTRQVEPAFISAIAQENLRQSLPFRWRMPWPSKSNTMQPFSLPVPSQPHPKGLTGDDSSLHGYMCKHWLTHNKHITSSHAGYATFDSLCLIHDNDLQPWALDHPSGTDQYLRMAEYAVMNNHAPVLQVLKMHSEKTRKNLWKQLAISLCPGTDSNFLHVASALNHVEVLSVLKVAHDSLVANGQGKSAAALAVELGNDDAFRCLIPDYPSLPVARLLPSQAGQKEVLENLLDVCASYGNVYAAKLVLTTMRQRYPEFDLIKYSVFAEALFVACSNGQSSMASQLVHWGANPNKLNAPGQEKQLAMSHWLMINQAPSLEVAMQLDNTQLFTALLAAGADPGFFENNILNIMPRFPAEPHYVRKWIDPLLLHASEPIVNAVRQQSCNLFCEMVGRRVDHLTTDMAAMKRHMSSTVGNTQRLLLPYCMLRTDTSEPHTHPLYQKLFNDRKYPVFDTWIEHVDERILLHSLNHVWIADRCFETVAFSKGLINRGDALLLWSVLENMVSRLKSRFQHVPEICNLVFPKSTRVTLVNVLWHLQYLRQNLCCDDDHEEASEVCPLTMAVQEMERQITEGIRLGGYFQGQRFFQEERYYPD